MSKETTDEQASQEAIRGATTEEFARTLFALACAFDLPSPLSICIFGVDGRAITGQCQLVTEGPDAPGVALTINPPGPPHKPAPFHPFG
jgi:hypothetical protein